LSRARCLVGDDIPLSVSTADRESVAVSFHAVFPDDESKMYNAYVFQTELYVDAWCKEDCDGFSGDLEIAIPKGVALTVQAGNDTVDVTGVEGDVSVMATSGKTTIRHVAGRVFTTAGQGDIRLDGIDGRVHASTVGGNIVLKNIAAQKPPGQPDLASIAARHAALSALPPIFQIEADTGGGKVSTDNTYGNARLGSIEGNVVAARATGNIEIAVESGNIDIRDTVGDHYLYISNSGNITGNRVDCEVCLAETVDGTVGFSD
jgi:DUF4097 and DUF4098 domain-containing protein YvlB